MKLSFLNIFISELVFLVWVWALKARCTLSLQAVKRVPRVRNGLIKFLPIDTCPPAAIGFAWGPRNTTA